MYHKVPAEYDKMIVLGSLCRPNRSFLPENNSKHDSCEAFNRLAEKENSSEEKAYRTRHSFCMDISTEFL